MAKEPTNLTPGGNLKAALPDVQDEESRAARNLRSAGGKSGQTPRSDAPDTQAPLTPTLGKTKEEAAAEAKNAEKLPGAHRLNPNKNAKLIAIDTLREEAQEATSEWRDGMERTDLEIEPEDVKQGKFRRLALIGILLILLVGIFVAIYAKNTDTAAQPQRDPTLVAIDNDKALIKEATRVLEGYLAAKSIPEKFAFTRDTEDRIRDMERYLGDRPSEQGIKIFARLEEFQLFSRQGKEFLGLAFDFDDASRRGVIFEITDQGPKLDWRSLVGYSDMSVDEFLEVQPLEPMLMRVVLVEDDYYNYHYGDPKKWVCVKVENASRDRSLWAYCPRHSPAHLALVAGEKELGIKRISIFEAVVQLRFEEAGRDRKQALLEEFVNAGHLIP